MYVEGNSQTEILNRMLDKVANDVDKAEKSLTYDALSPASNEFNKVYIALDQVANGFDMSKLTKPELDTRIYQLAGLTRKSAVAATGILNVTGTGTIPGGVLFQTPSGIQFKATETKTINVSGTINIEAVEAGANGIVPAGQITIIPIAIPGIISVTNNLPTSGGYDEESDEDFLQRFYDKTQKASNGQNIASFEAMAKDFTGVGDCKVYPTWNGNMTVKLAIIDSNKQPPSQTLIDALQTYMDPIGKQGQGYGAAPFGAFTTIVGATAKPINVIFTATRDTAYTDNQRQTGLEKALIEYFKEIAFQNNIVSYSRIGFLILNTPGFVDYSDLLINGVATNLPITYTPSLSEVPTLGVVSFV